MDGSVPVDRRSLPSDLAALVDDVDARDRGFFGPGSITWTVTRERILLASGVSTILLQLAHPAVAAGVADHSDFEAAPIGRFRRTFEYVHAIVFGDVDTAVAAALEVRERHAAVTGTIGEAVGPYATDDRYSASDPALLRWVHATLIEQSMTAYETYVAPLTAAERAAYYRESKRFGRLVGVPEAAYPDTVADFVEYYERMCTETLAVGHRARALQRTLFRQGRVLGPLYATVGIGTLPDAVREAYGLSWSSRHQRAFDAWTALVRTVVPRLPPRLRFVAAYRRARA